MELQRNFLKTLRSKLSFFSKKYIPVDRGILDSFMLGNWPYSKPGIIITFDDGLRNNFEVAKPLLEKYGFVGWFFIPVSFIKTAKEQQPNFAKKKRIAFKHSLPYAMTQSQVRELANKHIIGSHTSNHIRLTSQLSLEVLEKEIIASKEELSDMIDKKVDIFAWVGGEEVSYSCNASKVIKKAGYNLSFMTNNLVIRFGENPYHLQRTNIESMYSLELVKFQLSGIMDVLYMRKRHRVNKLTSVSN